MTYLGAAAILTTIKEARHHKNKRVVSGLLNRNINSATGVSSNRVAVRSASLALTARRTVAYVSQMQATPNNALGAKTAQELRPKMRTDGDRIAV